MTPDETSDIIERYRKAYEVANGKPAEKVEYRKGWFVWSGPCGGFKKRKAEIIATTGTLIYRASLRYL